MTIDLVPNSSYLGNGFNIFGKFDEDSCLRPLFDFTSPSGRTWTSPYTNVEYAIPININTPTLQAKTDGRAEVFLSREEFVSYLDGQAGLTGSYYGFTGEFKAAYSSEQMDFSDYSYALYHVELAGYNIAILDASQSKLSPAVLNDPDYQNLPSTYNEVNERLFFRFLSKYETHYVKGLSVGGRLHYYSAILKSFGFTREQLELNAKAEYKAVVATVEAQASLAWQAVDSNYAHHRDVTISVRGGTRKLLDGLTPSDGDNYNINFNNWASSVDAIPAVVGFQLAEVSELFSGEQREAVQQAVKAYAGNYLYLETPRGTDNSVTSNAKVILNGEVIGKAPNVNQSNSLQAAIVDRETLTVFLSKYYDITHSDPYPPLEQRSSPSIYDKIAQDLEPYEGRQDVIVAMLFSDVDSLSSYPSNAVSNFMLSIGAGNGLNRWSSDAISVSGETRKLSYILVGIPGWPPGKALERFEYAHFLSPHSISIEIETMSLQSFLMPQFEADEIKFYPQ